LSEGFATYFTLLFQESEYGSDEYIAGLLKARKFVIDYTKKDSSFSIIDNRTAESGPVTSGITYQKGAWVLHMLRNRMGNENFKKGIQAYYKKYYNSNTTTLDFIETMEIFAKEDLKSYLNQWLRNPYVLKIDGHWKYDSKNKQVVIDLTQAQSGNFIFNTPIELAIFNSNTQSSKIIKVDLNNKNSTYKIPVDQLPSHIVADPRTVLLADITFSKN
jgi:aminopeptidase N